LINNNKKTVLWGCSIEPTKIKGNDFLKKDLKKYLLITARESLTYNALIENGINKNTHLFPDPAFLLDKEIPTDLPSNFIPNNTIGLNLSPMIQSLEKGSNIAYKNFLELIKYIIERTQMNIALIPHVIIENNNDLEPLTKLYKQFKNTNRVCLIDKPYNACQLKGIISQCRFAIVARTHASIAAYSTQVPTLVIGYSIKAKGIANDIFGNYKDYVLPVQELKGEKEVLEAFKKLMQNETKIREHYKNFMPEYIEKTWLAGKEIEKLLNR
jgi:polysaccharide pyruvyl transferase WcaK-like protein